MITRFITETGLGRLSIDGARQGRVLREQSDQEGAMITRFHFKGHRRIFRFDFLGPPWVFLAFILMVVVALILATILRRLLL
jgi:hypothetical protein